MFAPPPPLSPGRIANVVTSGEGNGRMRPGGEGVKLGRGQTWGGNAPLPFSPTAAANGSWPSGGGGGGPPIRSNGWAQAGWHGDGGRDGVDGPWGWGGMVTVKGATGVMGARESDRHGGGETFRR